MAKKELLRRYTLFTIALFVNSFSIALVTKGLLGTTPISSIPYVFSLFTKLTIGQYTLALNFLQVLVALALMNKQERHQHFTGKQWGDPRNYDLMINTASIPIHAATHLISNLYHHKASTI